MKRKQPTMLDSIIKNYGDKSIKELMIEDFKQSLLEPKRVVFVDDQLNNPQYLNFTGPNEDGIMNCDLYLDREYRTITNELLLSKSYRVVSVMAIPDLLYYQTDMKVGVIHTAKIAETGYVITYRMDGK